MIEDVSDVKYVHYGSKVYDPEKFKPICNRESGALPKPRGGLWACRPDAEYGWKEWCENNDFREYKEDDFFMFTINSDKVCVIRSAEEGHELAKHYGKLVCINGITYDCMETIDWDEVKHDYDALEIVISDDSDLYYDFYGWDCDSIVVFNPDVIVPEVVHDH